MPAYKPKPIPGPEADDCYVRDTVIAAFLGVSRPTVWTFAKTYPDFPQPRKLSPQTTRFHLRSVRLWAESRG